MIIITFYWDTLVSMPQASTPSLIRLWSGVLFLGIEAKDTTEGAIVETQQFR